MVSRDFFLREKASKVQTLKKTTHFSLGHIFLVFAQDPPKSVN